MLLLNPIMAMLHDTTNDRWHPIVFQEQPLPGGCKTPVRHKSMGHHTDGFATREEALQNCEETIAASEQTWTQCLDKAFPWDGKDIPAMVVFFGEREEMRR